MGVYDFFKGQCPNCNRNVDNHPEFGVCGNIQTKYFITDDDECFRNFYPGKKVPFAPNNNFIIGKTCCCDTLIKACFDKDILVKYEIASSEEIEEHNRIEIARKEWLDKFIEDLKISKY